MKDIQALLCKDLTEVKLPDRDLHLAIGMFDGVHLGHQAVIDTALQLAHSTGGLAGVLTFWPHPSRLFAPEKAVKMILPPEMKFRVLAAQKLDVVIQKTFDKELAAIPADDFLKYLKGKIPRLNSVHVGSNWRFGKGRSGDIQKLIDLGREAGINVVSVERVKWNGEAISSTRIRKHLQVGEIDRVNSLLGYHYFCMGEVIPGKQLGRKVGFPTLNIAWQPELEPAWGVYCVRVKSLDDMEGPGVRGVANYGVRPTVEDTEIPVLEIHCMDHCPFDTGMELHVEWLHFIRPERRFENVEALREQIVQDRDAAASYWKL